MPGWHNCFLPERIKKRLPLKKLYIAVHPSRVEIPSLPKTQSPQNLISSLFTHDDHSRLQTPNSHYRLTFTLSLTKPLAHP